MKFNIHKPSSVLPEVNDVVLLADRVQSAFASHFEAQKQATEKLHHAFDNRYFIVFQSLEAAQKFCREKLANYIMKPQENSPRIELRGIVEDKESKHAFCVMNINFPKTQLTDEYIADLEEHLFS